MTERKTKMVPLGELTLMDRFLFDAAMENEEVHRAVLEIILGRDIALLTKNETEKELRTSPLLRSIRMDVFPWMRTGLYIIRKCRSSLSMICRNAADTTSHYWILRCWNPVPFTLTC